MLVNRRLLIKKPFRQPANVDTKYAKQSGGKGQYGHVVIEFDPGEPGAGYEFENKVVGGAIPKEYIPAVRCRYSRSNAKLVFLLAIRLLDVKASLVDGILP